MLIYGTREPNDMAWNPRSQTIFFRGLGVSGQHRPARPSQSRAGRRRRLMAFDAELADRIRALLGDRAEDEKKVFGGLAFMIGGNMAVAASSNGGIIVRVDPADRPRARRDDARAS